MNTLELLLAQYAEECGEGTQAAVKILRFGLLSPRPKDGKTNLQLFVDEYNDILGTMQLLSAEIEKAIGQPIEGLGDPVAIQARIEKIGRMAAVSYNLGLLQADGLPEPTNPIQSANAAS